MADLISDGNIRVTWVPTVANIAAPTVAEINAGLRIDNIMTPDGLKITPSTAAVDTSALSSTYSTMLAGRRSFDNSVTLKKQTTGDTAFTTLVYQAVGYLVVRRNLAAGTAPATSQNVEVYPAQCGEQQKAYGPNTVQAYEVPLFMSADANTVAVVA